MGVLDILNMITSPMFPGFTPRHDIADIPLVGTLTASLGSLFVERGGTQESRDNIVRTIIER